MNGQHRYVLSKPKDGEDLGLRLMDAIKVSKLKENQMKMYFNSLRVEKKSGRECGSRKEETREETFDEKLLKSFLKRYGVRKRGVEKPVMKRMPLRTVKTIHVELPVDCTVDALTDIQPRRKLSSPYIEIAKALTRNNCQKDVDVVKSSTTLGTSTVEDGDDFQFDNNAISTKFIEKQLQATKNEINLASIQLEQIKALLAQRKCQLSPVLEEEDQVQSVDQASKTKTKDRKNVDVKKKPEWKLKTSSNPRNGRKKLMVTLDSLNQRLQKIQEKYFTEPRMKFKTIDQILAQPNSKNIETIYQNHDFRGTNFSKPPNTGAVKLKSNMTKTDFSPKPKAQSPKSPKQIDPVEIILSPRFEIFQDSEVNIPVITENVQRNQPQKGILRKANHRDGSVEVCLGSHTLQDSIFKSDFLKKEFDVRPSDDFDFGDLKMKKGDFACTDFMKKNVRFAQSRPHLIAKAATKSDKELQQAIDYALKNSLFYPEM